MTAPLVLTTSISSTNTKSPGSAEPGDFVLCRKDVIARPQAVAISCGIVVVCNAVAGDCHVAFRLLAMTRWFLAGSSDLAGQQPKLVGGVMTPPDRDCL